MEKQKKKKLSKATVILSVFMVLFFALGLLMVILREKSEVSFWIFGLSTDEILPIIKFIGKLLLVADFISGSIHEFKNNKIKFCAVSLLLTLVIAGFPLWEDCQSSKNYKYQQIISPDGNHEIIIQEGSYLFEGLGSFYEKTSPCTMKKIGTYRTDDGYRPFSNGRYEITWHSNGADISYSYSGNGNYKTETVNYIK